MVERLKNHDGWTAMTDSEWNAIPQAQKDEWDRVRHGEAVTPKGPDSPVVEVEQLRAAIREYFSLVEGWCGSHTAKPTHTLAEVLAAQKKLIALADKQGTLTTSDQPTTETGQ